MIARLFALFLLLILSVCIMVKALDKRGKGCLAVSREMALWAVLFFTLAVVTFVNL